ncbi:hypothetical protein SC171_21800 [Pantoea cypripedii]|uniref:hypothetical protein n=1 Tax=Pantoea cypripedii TaxID=55209 RepID=UPI002FC6DC10
MKNNNYYVLGYSRGSIDERNEQNHLLLTVRCHWLVEDPDQSNALCPALQNLPEVKVVLLMTNLNTLRGSSSGQLSLLRKWLLSGHQIITLDGVINSLLYPEVTAFVSALAGHNPLAQNVPSGRPSGLSRKALQLKEQAIGMYTQTALNSNQCARRLGIARSTYYRYLDLQKT